MDFNKNKRGQIDIPVITWVIVIIGIVIIAPIILMIVNSIIGPFGNALAEQSAYANESAQSVVQDMNDFWDFGMLLVFLIITIMMFISAYFIDVHPLFIVFYILLAFFLFLIMAPIQETLTTLYDPSITNMSVTDLPFSNFIASNFWMICLMLYSITGIIMYGKMRTRSIY